MKYFLEYVISKLKKQSNYKISGDYTLWQYFIVVLYRSFQVFRGFKLRFFAKEIEGILFLGRGVVVEHAYLLSAGANLIIEDFAYINALSVHGVSFGRNVTIGRQSIIVATGVLAHKGGGVTLGNYSTIGAQSFIGGQGGIEIGDNVLIGPGVRIFSENHNFSDPSLLIRCQGERRVGVRIGNNCWIGAGVTILDGVIIGDGCVIGAGSIVSSNIDSNTILYNKITPIKNERFK